MNAATEIKADHRLPVACACCGWTGRRLSGQIVTCPKCGKLAAFQMEGEK